MTMKNKSISGLSLKTKAAAVLLLYVFFVFLYFFIANPQLKYKTDASSIVRPAGTTVSPELASSVIAEQTIPPRADALQRVSILFTTFDRENKGTIELRLLDGDKVLYQSSISMSDMNGNYEWSHQFLKPLDFSGDSFRLVISAVDAMENSTVSLLYTNQENPIEGELTLNGEPVEGMLCMNVSYANETAFYLPYFLCTGIIGAFLLIYILRMLYCEKSGKKCYGIIAMQAFARYSFLLKQLVSRDFKLKYRRSILGGLWSILNPLLMMLVISSVFSYMFRFEIKNFPVYLILGQTLFNFFSEATNTSMTAILSSAGLIKKVYIPKYIFPVEKVLFAFVNFFISLTAVVIVMIVFRIQPQVTLFFLPLLLVYVLLFTMGIAILLSSICVFFRDTIHLYGVLLIAWMYLTPIFYPVDQLNPWMRNILMINPMTHFVQYFRNIAMYGVVPSVETNLICLAVGIGSLLIGLAVFKKQQDRFILHI